MILAFMLVLGYATAEAAPVDELELDGTASNNSLATAQAIPPSAFTLPLPPEVFNPPGFRTASLFGRGGGPDVDIFRISGHGQLLLDIDTSGPGLGHPDTVLFLWNSSGVSLATNDDASINEFPNDVPNEDLGSNHTHDSRIFVTLPKPDVYFVGITRYLNTIDACLGSVGPNPPCDFPNGFFENGPQPPSAGYLLHLSLEHPHRVSVPPALALLVCSVGLTVGARCLTRRRSR